MVPHLLRERSLCRGALRILLRTVREIGDPIVFPAVQSYASCYCEISTAELGDEVCPHCGRRLRYVQVAD